MKKVSFMLLVLLAASSCKNTPDASLNSEVKKLRQEVAELKQQLDEKDDDDATEDESAPMDDSTPEDNNSIDFALTGRIGGYYNCSMVLENGEGTVHLGGGSRDVVFNSYNRNSGQLVLDAYMPNGKYIGQYVGKYGKGGYNGTFYNVKGSTVTFELSR